MAAAEWRAAARRERTVAVLLVSASLVLAVLAALGLPPPSPWKWIRAVFGPIGAPFLHVEE
jgi:peptidoglycan/LPS O-acetylase OafA/YrhL